MTTKRRINCLAITTNTTHSELYVEFEIEVTSYHWNGKKVRLEGKQIDPTNSRVMTAIGRWIHKMQWKNEMVVHTSINSLGHIIVTHIVKN